MRLIFTDYVLIAAGSSTLHNKPTIANNGMVTNLMLGIISLTKKAYSIHLFIIGILLVYVVN